MSEFSINGCQFDYVTPKYSVHDIDSIDTHLTMQVFCRCSLQSSSLIHGYPPNDLSKLEYSLLISAQTNLVTQKLSSVLIYSDFRLYGAEVQCWNNPSRPAEFFNVPNFLRVCAEFFNVNHASEFLRFLQMNNPRQTC